MKKTTLIKCTPCAGTGEQLTRFEDYHYAPCVVCNGAGTVEVDVPQITLVPDEKMLEAIQENFEVLRRPRLAAQNFGAITKAVPQHPDSPYNDDRHQRDYEDID